MQILIAQNSFSVTNVAGDMQRRKNTKDEEILPTSEHVTDQVWITSKGK